MSDCKECGGSGWVNAAGFKPLPTDEMDPQRLPCGSCRPMLAPEPQAVRQTFSEIGKDIGDLVAVKNAAYGDSFARCGDFLRLLYPAGIRPDQYADALGLVRVFDKQMRIATAKDALGESPWRDIAGYGILGVANDGRGR